MCVCVNVGFVCTCVYICERVDYIQKIREMCECTYMCVKERNENIMIRTGAKHNETGRLIGPRGMTTRLLKGIPTQF
jgi:hypothetical protein